MQQGQRYWYYYIMDGYHVSHDPAHESVVEPTTGRKLNILDVPAGKSSRSSRSAESTKRSSRRMSKEVPRGRGVSPSQIKIPKPYNPVQTAHLVAADYSQATVAQLTARFGHANLDDESDSDSDSDSDADSDVPSLTSSRSSNSSSPSSVSSSSTLALANAMVLPARVIASSLTVVVHDVGTLMRNHVLLRAKRRVTRLALPADTVLSSVARLV